MEEIEIAYCKMHADCAAEPKATHNSDDFNEAAVEFCAPGCKQEKRTN